VQSGKLSTDDIPPALRDVHRNIIKRSPMHVAIDRPYNLAPLLAYYVGRFQQPQPRRTSGFKRHSRTSD
jgi:hypothetical protein